MKLYIKSIQVISLIILAVQSLIASPQYIFRHLDIVDGMSDNQIRGLSMLPDGRLSVRTASILNIYNGASFDHYYYTKNKEYKWDYWGLPKEYCDAENRLWMKERDYLLLLDLNTNQFIYDIDNELKQMGIFSKIKNLFIDDMKNYWFLTEEKTFAYFDITEKKLITVTEGNSDFVRQYGVPKELAQYKNFCWIVYTSGLIRCWDYSSKEFVSRENRFLHTINEQTDRVYIHTTQTGDVWLMYNHAISFFNRADGNWTEIAAISGRSNFFTCMDIDMDGNVWVGTSLSGLRFIDSRTFEVSIMPGMQLDTGDMLINDIYTIFADNNNGVWIGTLFQGLCYYQPSMRKFRLVQTVENSGSLTSENVRCFFEENDSCIIVGTANGLFRFRTQTSELEQIHKELANELCLHIYKDSRQRLWVATFLGGFYCIEGNTIRNYKWNQSSNTQEPVYNTARYIYEDKDGRYWVSIGGGTQEGGVGEFFPETGEIKMLSESHPKVAFHKLDYEIFPVDESSFAVIGESGIYYYNTRTDSLFIPELDDPDNPRYQGQNTRYYCIFTDSRSLEWKATEIGINSWDGKKLYNITTENGLPSNTVSTILEDNDGVIWASTANGISKIQVKKEEDNYEFSIVNFGISDGLQSGKFYSQSGLKTADGTIFFGGVHGFNYFNPRSINYNEKTYRPIFTSFSLFNSGVKEGVKYKNRVILDKPINKTQEIVLKHNENFISLEFAGLNYVNPAQTYFRYKLENFDQGWTEIVTNGAGKVTYTGLTPGTYQLIVYSANNDKFWSQTPAKIKIVIIPPFWATTYAFIIYFILFILGLILLVYFMEKRNRRKLEAQKEVSERQQIEELNQMKFRFFTNISHEFRTPLTLIITPLDILVKNEKDEKQKKKLLSIQRNANDLLILVNQLLDFRKLEMKGEKLVLSKSNIVEFVENIYIRFKDHILSKNIDFSITKEIDVPIIYFDKNKMYKVVNNLLSNALKFTPDGGFISIRMNTDVENDRNFIKIAISDSGCGIAKDELNKIFDRFYQSNKKEETPLGSSGIGLHLVKEYVDMHEGKITVESEKDKGSVFTVYIPADLKSEEDISDRNGQEQEKEIESESEQPSSKKTVLVIEDNTEFRHFLAEQLNNEFKALEAEDGEVGEKMAIQYSPDLIVSDLMMPKMDGLTLCKKLKANIQTSHIPFILLTARSSDEAKMDGYEAGADSYISKPFNFDMLAIRIRKLIEQQEKRQELFHKSIEVTPSSITINSLDEEFIQKALRYVEKNMDNTEYSIENLSSDVGLHRSHLYRKLQSITGQTPIDFMRTIRLKRAAQLLKDSRYNISEIAYMVGFNTIKYFNKYFKEEFGMTPTQYRNSKQ